MKIFEKMMLYIKKSDIKKIIINSLVFVFIFIVCFSNIFTKTIGNLDEIWNYNFARNIADGLVPYKDFNMIVMPGLFMLCAFILNVFGNQLIVMRFLAVLLMSFIFFISYKILEKIAKKEIAIFALIGAIVMFRDILCIDYNYAILLMALILLYLELKNCKNDILKYNFKLDLLLGLLAGVAILFKQTTGIAISMACVGYKILAIRKKEDIKEFIKIAGTRLFGVVIPVSLFIIYLFYNNITDDFIDYTILGLKTFSNKISYTKIIEQYLIFGVSVPVTLLIMFIMLFFKNTRREIYPLFAYSISSFIVTFPICDKIHFVIGSFITFLSMIYLVYIIFIKDNIKSVRKNIKVILYGTISFLSMLLCLIIVCMSIKDINENYIKVDKETKLEHFIGIPENKGLNDRIFEIDNFILEQEQIGKKVYILDAEAAIYNIPLNIYNKDYDMFNKGNLGSKGEQGIIERIISEGDCVYLLKKDNINWQNPNEVRKYIIENLNFKGEISIFWIFEK